MSDLWRCLACKFDWPSSLLITKSTSLAPGRVFGCCPKCKGDVFGRGKLTFASKQDQADYDKKFSPELPVDTVVGMVRSRHEPITREEATFG